MLQDMLKNADLIKAKWEGSIFSPNSFFFDIIVDDEDREIEADLINHEGDYHNFYDRKAGIYLYKEQDNGDYKLIGVIKDE